MEQNIIDAIDAPPIEGLGILVIVPEGWGGASAILTLTCGTENPMTAIIEGIECNPKKAIYNYRLSEPSTLLIVDADIPRPCHLHIELLATKGSITSDPMSWTQSATKTGSMTVGVSDSNPIVIGLPYSIYEPLTLT